jgi:hypothetical protein
LRCKKLRVVLLPCCLGYGCPRLPTPRRLRKGFRGKGQGWEYMKGDIHGAVRMSAIADLAAKRAFRRPLFRGLAVSLVFGLLVSTLLTQVMIPIMYYAFMR